MCTYIHGYLHPCWFCIGIINITWPQSHTHLLLVLLLQIIKRCCHPQKLIITRIFCSRSQCSIFVAQVPLTLTQAGVAMNRPWKPRGNSEWMINQLLLQQGAPCGSTTSSCGRIDGAGPFFEDVGWHDDYSLKLTNCSWKLVVGRWISFWGFGLFSRANLLEVPKPQVEMVEKEAGKKIACGFEENCSSWWF